MNKIPVEVNYFKAVPALLGYDPKMAVCAVNGHSDLCLCLSADCFDEDSPFVDLSGCHLENKAGGGGKLYVGVEAFRQGRIGYCHETQGGTLNRQGQMDFDPDVPEVYSKMTPAACKRLFHTPPLRVFCTRSSFPQYWPMDGEDFMDFIGIWKSEEIVRQAKGKGKDAQAFFDDICIFGNIYTGGIPSYEEMDEDYVFKVFRSRQREHYQGFPEPRF